MTYSLQFLFLIFQSNNFFFKIISHIFFCFMFTKLVIAYTGSESTIIISWEISQEFSLTIFYDSEEQ